MAKDVEDNKTPDLLGDSDLVVSAVIEQAYEDAHLAQEHQLVAVRAYIKDAVSAKEKTGNALRQAKYSEKLKAAGLVKAHIPAEVASEIKVVGSFETWLEAQKASAVAPVEKVVTVPGPERIVEVPGPERIVYRDVPVPGPERVIEVEKIVQVPTPPTEKGLYFRALGKRVDSLVGWRRALVMALIGK